MLRLRLVDVNQALDCKQNTVDMNRINYLSL